MATNEIIFTTSDFIQLIGILTSLLTGLIAIIISCFTLRQNSKMIEESSRPIICVYTRSINSGRPTLYLVVKNFGNSTAYMKKFISDTDFTGCYQIPNTKNYIEEFCNCTIAPNQSFTCLLDYDKIKSPVHFSIAYNSSTKKYHEELTVDLKAAANMPSSKYSSENKDLLSISYSLQEMLLKNL